MDAIRIVGIVLACGAMASAVITQIVWGIIWLVDYYDLGGKSPTLAFWIFMIPLALAAKKRKVLAAERAKSLEPYMREVEEALRE